jgi:peptidyl-prolyl cis-trans isomerase C
MIESMYQTMKIFRKIFFFLPLLLAVSAVAQDSVVEDGSVIISDKEFEYLVTRWTPQMRDVAVQDQGDRLELINMALANKKIAAIADDVAKDNADVTWQYLAGLEVYKRNFVLQWYRDNIQKPDFSVLAKEQYTVKREKYAAIPERRISSHILFAVPVEDPIDDALRQEAQAVLDELRAGADFVSMVKLHSGEPGAAAKEGKFDRWVASSDKGISPPYTQALFTIENVGDYTDLVTTQFGLHIIRLDGIQEKGYKTFEEVESTIVEKLESEYVQLAMKDYLSQFHISDDAVIDNEAIDRILEPYASQE